MELLDVLKALENVVFEKEIRKQKWYLKTREESSKIHDKIDEAIEEIENEELKEKLGDLFFEYSDLGGETMSHLKSYAYEKGAIIGQAFKHLKNI